MSVNHDDFALVSEAVAKEVLWAATKNFLTLDHLVRACGVSTFAYDGDVYIILAQRGLTATTLTPKFGTQVVKILSQEILAELNTENCGRPFLIVIGMFLKKLNPVPTALFEAVERHTKIALFGTEFETLPEDTFDEDDGDYNDSLSDSEEFDGLPSEIADFIRNLRAQGFSISVEHLVIQLPPGLDPEDEDAVFEFIMSQQEHSNIDDGSHWPKHDIDNGDE